MEVEESHRGWSVRRSRGLDRGLRRGGGRRGRDRRRARRRRRRGSGGSPAAPAGRIDRGRPAPPSAGRRCRARAGSTSAGRARGGCRSIRRRRSPGRWRHRRRGLGFEHDEERLRAPGERRQPAEPVGDASRTIRDGQPATGQVEHEQVDRAAGQQRATDGQALVEGLGGDDDQPFEANATGDGLDRVEAARQVEPGDDGSGGLGLRREPQDERRPAARAVAADRDARRTRQAAGPQDRVECREAGVDDAVVRVGAGRGPWPDIGEWHQGRFGRQRERPHDPRSCGTPAGPEARDSGVHFGTRGRHRTPRLEHLFYSDKAQR